MLAIERKALIKEAVLEKKSVVVSELSQQFDVTEETIRRDLKALEAEGFLTRTYGGAFIQEGSINDVDVSVRETAYVESKKQIALQCLSLVNNGDAIFLDGSTTALETARALQGMHLTVLTNSLLIADLLAKSQDIRLIIIGGTLYPQSMCFFGNATLEELTTYYVDTAFISCRSLSLQNGVTDSTEQNAALRKKIVTRADRTYLLADHTKFNRTSFIKICDFQELRGIITDQALSPEWHQMAAESHLELLEFTSQPAKKVRK